MTQADDCGTIRYFQKPFTKKGKVPDYSNNLTS
jgi:hypothetical protein